jgi:hypothetical protein
VALRTLPIALAPENPPDRLGSLRFIGARQFLAADPRVGGVSGLLVDDALRLTAVTDTGLWLTARIVIAADRLAGVEDLVVAPIQDGAGQPLPRGRMGDAESLARLPDGSLLVGFERWHRIRRFASPTAPGLFFPTPPGLEVAPGNEALETLTTLADGRLLAIEEGRDDDTPRRAWLGGPALGGAAGWAQLTYQAALGFRPTDAAGLPAGGPSAGGALVLERSFSPWRGFGSRIAHLGAAALAGAAAGTTLRPVEVARIEPPLLSDNYEAIAVARRQAGGLYVFLASDDNFNALQRTLLLAFVLEDALP